MPKLRTFLLIGAGTVLFAGVAAAATAKLHTMSVDLPDGSVAHVQYVGDVAPKVSIDPADAQEAAYPDPFAAMDADFARVSAMMERQRQETRRQVTAMQQQAAAGGQPGQFVVSGDMPAGSSYSYSVVSSSSGQGTCTQSVEWHSNGAGQQPQVTRASSGDCGAVQRGEGDKPVPASAPQKAAPVDPRTI